MNEERGWVRVGYPLHGFAKFFGAGTGAPFITPRPPRADRQGSIRSNFIFCKSNKSGLQSSWPRPSPPLLRLLVLVLVLVLVLELYGSSGVSCGCYRDDEC